MIAKAVSWLEQPLVCKDYAIPCHCFMKLLLIGTGYLRSVSKTWKITSIYALLRRPVILIAFVNKKELLKQYRYRTCDLLCCIAGFSDKNFLTEPEAAFTFTG